MVENFRAGNKKLMAEIVAAWEREKAVIGELIVNFQQQRRRVAITNWKKAITNPPLPRNS